MKKVEKLKENKPAQYLVFVLAFLVVFLIVNSVTSLTTGRSIINRILKENTGEIPSVEIESDDYNNPASWHITKSAKWTDNGKAKVTFDLDTIMKTSEKNVDLVLVLDNSGSMSGSKLAKIKEDTKELINSVLSNTNNKIALINFNAPTSTIQSGLTNDKNLLISKVEGLSSTGWTNYNIGLKNVLEVLNGYQKEANRDIVLVFMSDGEPNTDVHNQIATYELIKDKYPYMTVNAVQYDMGREIKESLKKVSDNQFWAYSTDTDNMLLQVALDPIKYENFIVTDYIEDEYFYVKSVDDIKVARGTVKLTEENGLQKIVWNIGKQPTGFKSKMEINLTLKDKDFGNTEYFPTNEKETIETKIPEENKKTINSDKTPVLPLNNVVIYDSNPPTGCKRETSEEKHTPYSNVTIKEEEPTCNGYNFKGWVIEEDVVKINDDVFQMPEKDVHIKGTWGKPSIVKRMDGIVHEAWQCPGGVLVDDPYETGRQIYQGSDPCNYIKLGNDMYRIIAIEADGTYKVIKNDSLGNIPFDPGRSTSIQGITEASSDVGTRYNSSGYCNSTFGCKVWGSKTTTLDSNGNNITTMPREIGGTEYALPDDESYLNVYLNGGTYAGVSIDGWINTLPDNIKSKVQTYTFNVGLLKSKDVTFEINFEEDIEQEKTYKWNGKVGLMSPIDYVKANSNIKQCGSIQLVRSNYSKCKTTDWLFNSAYQWILPPNSHSDANANHVWCVNSNGSLSSIYAFSTSGVRPVFFLSSDIQLSGTGTSDDPFIITN